MKNSLTKICQMIRLNNLRLASVNGMSPDYKIMKWEGVIPLKQGNFILNLN